MWRFGRGILHPLGRLGLPVYISRYKYSSACLTLWANQSYSLHLTCLRYCNNYVLCMSVIFFIFALTLSRYYVMEQRGGALWRMDV